MDDFKSRGAKRSSFMLSLCCVCVACGGGGDGGGAEGNTPVDSPAPVVSQPLAIATINHEPSINPSPAQPEVPATVSATTAMVSSCQSSGASGFQHEVLQRVNALRAAGAVCGTAVFRAAPALNWNSLLFKAAHGHSVQMAQNNYFSHDGRDGKVYAQRLTDVGYNFSAAGENIAAGDLTVEQVVNHWLRSPGHCANMMNPTYLDVGVACASSNNTSYGNYWTMDLGR